MATRIYNLSQICNIYPPFPLNHCKKSHPLLGRIQQVPVHSKRTHRSASFQIVEKVPRRDRRCSGESSQIHFRPGRVPGRKYLSGCKCGICSPWANKLCAQQTAKTCREAPMGIFDSLKQPSHPRWLLFYALIFCPAAAGRSAARPAGLLPRMSGIRTSARRKKLFAAACSFRRRCANRGSHYRFSAGCGPAG